MKKAQITVFVILGLVLVIMVGLALYIKNSAVPPAIKPINVDKEIQGFHQAIQDCMFLSLKDAVIPLGMQGGYIAPVLHGLRPDPNFPTSGNAFYMTPDFESFIIPYWSYMSSDNTCLSECRFLSGRPHLTGPGGTSFESQISVYVGQRAEQCIEIAKQEYENRGYEIHFQTAPKYTTIISENNVQVELERKTRIMLEGKEYMADRYRTELDIPLKKYYQLATDIITDLQNQNVQYLELLTMEMIAPYALSVDAELPPLPKIMDTSLGATNMWILTSVKEKIKDLLTDNIGSIRFQGTRNYAARAVFDSPITDAVYRNFYVAVGNEESPYNVRDYTITIDYYPWWEPYVSISPERKMIIKPETMRNNFPIPISFKRYYFGYDISYPVLIQIYDPNALDGDGYLFQYGYEVNIRESQPMGPDMEAFTVDAPIPSLLCEENQKRSGDIIVKTSDYFTGAPVEALVEYACGLESCELGMTSLSGGVSKLSARLPQCIDGRIVPSKEGYFGHSVQFTSLKDTEAELETELEKIVDINLVVRKIPVEKNVEVIGGGAYVVVWSLSPGVVRYLERDEWAMVVLNRIPEAGEESFTQMAVFRWNEDIVPIKLVTGSYEVEVYIFKDIGEEFSTEQIVFRSKRYCGGGVLGFGRECETVGPVVFDSTFPLGSLKIEGEHAFVVDNIEPYLEIRVPYIELTGDEDIEDLEAIDRSQIVYNQLSPIELMPLMKEEALE